MQNFGPDFTDCSTVITVPTIIEYFVSAILPCSFVDAGAFPDNSNAATWFPIAIQEKTIWSNSWDATSIQEGHSIYGTTVVGFRGTISFIDTVCSHAECKCPSFVPWHIPFTTPLCANRTFKSASFTRDTCDGECVLSSHTSNFSHIHWANQSQRALQFTISEYVSLFSTQFHPSFCDIFSHNSRVLAATFSELDPWQPEFPI